MSISAAVLSRLRLIRIAPSITESSSPIACNTGDGSLDPLAQAEPVEQAIPAMSKASTISCRFSPGKEMFEMCGENHDQLKDLSRYETGLFEKLWAALEAAYPVHVDSAKAA